MWTLSTLVQVSQAIQDETQRYEVVIYAELTNEFRPFMQEDRVSYLTSLPKRDEAFRQVLIKEYDYACAVCEMKFKVDNLTKRRPRTSSPKDKNGTDDPRNGLTLCRAHHWAFERGCSRSPWITPSSSVHSCSARTAASSKCCRWTAGACKFPKREVIAPHRAALEWHQANVFQG